MGFILFITLEIKAKKFYIYFNSLKNETIAW